jgi:MFS family permease
MTRTERTYYLVVSMYHASWSFLGPVYALFLLGRGLDLFEINLVLATYLITAFLFEVPTGAIADVFGRKNSFVLSCLVRAVAFQLYWVSDDLPDFLLAEFIDAIGTTLATGALDAWAVDGMKAEGKGGSTDGFFARAQMLTRGTMIVTGVASGYMVAYGMELPWLMGSATFLLTAVVGWWQMVDDRPAERSLRTALRETRRAFSGTVLAGWHEVRRHPVMRLICVLTAAMAFAVMPAYHTWQPHLQSLSTQGMWVLGWTWALLNLAVVFASLLVHRLPHLPRAYVVAVATLVRGIMLAVAAVSPTLAPAIIGFVIFEFGMGVSEPLLLGWMNDHAGSEQRATVLSVRQMSFTLGGGIGLLVLGVVARDHGIPAAWLVCAALLVVAAAGFVALDRSTRTGRGAAE